MQSVTEELPVKGVEGFPEVQLQTHPRAALARVYLVAELLGKKD